MAQGSATISTGSTVSISNVLAGTSIGVQPGAGGTMKIQYRISSNGPLRDWPLGEVSENADDVTTGTVFQIAFTALGAPGFLEWNK